MGLRDEVRAELFGPGGMFEMVEEDVLGHPALVFGNRRRSLRELVANAAAHGDAEFLVLDDQRITFAEFVDLVGSASRALVEDHGIRPGDRVAIYAANCPEWIIAFFATVSVGGIVAAFNGWWTTEEARHALELSEPALLIGDRKRLARLDGIDHGVPVVEIETAFASLLRHPSEPLPTQPIAEDDPAVILFTSGTTGRSKGAVTSHRGLIGFIDGTFASGAERAMLAAREGEPPAQRLEGQMINLSISPLFHVSGLHGQTMIGITVGAKMVFRRGGFDPEAIMALIERERITNFSALGSMGPRLLDSPAFGRYDLSSLVNVGFGGAPTSPALQQRVREAFPNAAAGVGSGYGSSESVAVVASIGGRAYREHPEATGFISPVFEIEIRDDDGNVLPEGEEGEVHVRSAYTMLEYWRNPEATAATIKPGRWLAMGDIGRMEGELLYLNSRARDMILRSAENIYPVEIEYRLDAHPDVAESAVFGVDHPDLGQEVKAVVVPVAGATVTPDELAAWCGESLAGYKVPSLWEIRAEPMPRNAAGKVLKQVLRGESELTQHEE